MPSLLVSMPSKLSLQNGMHIASTLVDIPRTGMREKRLYKNRTISRVQFAIGQQAKKCCAGISMSTTSCPYRKAGIIRSAISPRSVIFAIDRKKAVVISELSTESGIPINRRRSGCARGAKYDSKLEKQMFSSERKAWSTEYEVGSNGGLWPKSATHAYATEQRLARRRAASGARLKPDVMRHRLDTMLDILFMVYT